LNRLFDKHLFLLALSVSARLFSSSLPIKILIISPVNTIKALSYINTLIMLKFKLSNRANFLPFS